ncbi:hypothetical protein EQG49_02370 [Periweissella cryptocerci]|uniref:DNA adenine methylase n=1 Tax=Periweissella cryptocerci TaxID=2506420 RepID=A0A4P6YRZ9_9LACO|nr:DNA adenine methylase [Periweissella cryptocerci]QBO35392.1 hypothetical protein EQG49_02370 [Periweissella cryptocerci]
MLKIKSSKLGMPYQGSKRALSGQILSKIVNKVGTRDFVLYDLFGGGGAMTAAVVENGIPVHYNELDPKTYELFEYVMTHEEFPDEFYKWYSHEEADELVKQDGVLSSFIRIVWSFGNGVSKFSYLYGTDIEPFKKLGHYAVVFGDKQSIDKLNRQFSTDAFSVFDTGENTYKGRDLKVRRLSFGQITKKLNLELNETVLQHLQGLEQLNRLEHLQRLEQLNRRKQLTFSNGDYRTIEIPDNAVIYVDPPYRGTAGYAQEFDTKAFDKWVSEQTVPVFISEYNAPFEVIWGKVKAETFSHTAKRTKNVEKLFWNGISKIDN